MSYVYLVRHATEPMFKIGKADDPFGRFRAFNEKLDINNSLQLYLGERSSDFEKGLHALFDGYRLPPISSGDGATEWFNIECWNRCLAFFEQNHDLIGIAPEPISQMSPVNFNTLTDEERAERRRKNKESERLRIYNENLNSVSQWEQWLTWLTTQEISEERVNEYGRLEIVLLGISKEKARDLFYSSRIGRSGFNIEDNWYPCGIEEAEWCEEGERLTLMLRRFNAVAMALARTKLDLDLRGNFEAMDAWIVERMSKISQVLALVR